MEKDVRQNVCMCVMSSLCCRAAIGLPGGSAVKNLPANAGDTGNTGSIPGSRKSPGEENGSLLQRSCLGNPMDRRPWRATVPGVAESQTQLNTWHFNCPAQERGGVPCKAESSGSCRDMGDRMASGR